MQTWIALLKGINVGGKNVIPMATLRLDFEALKFQNVRTYIQSGNVLFESSLRSSDKIRKSIVAELETRRKIVSDVLVLKAEQLIEAVENNPFFEAVSDPSQLHFFFLLESCRKADFKWLNSIKTQSESFEIVENVFYLHAPDGIGRSKLVANIEKGLGVATTARNYRTLEKLCAMLAENES